MTTPNKLNEFHHAEDPARILLEKSGVDPTCPETLPSRRAGR